MLLTTLNLQICATHNYRWRYRAERILMNVLIAIMINNIWFKIDLLVNFS